MIGVGHALQQVGTIHQQIALQRAQHQTAMQQAALTGTLQSGLAQSQQGAIMGDLLNAAPGALIRVEGNRFHNCYVAGNALQNVVPPPSPSLYLRARARHYAETAQALAERVAFWEGVGSYGFMRLLADRKIEALAVELEVASEDAERFLEMANREDA